MQHDRRRGQAIVELAVAFPVLMMLLLAIVALGTYYVAATQQAAASTTIAQWSAAHLDATDADRATFTLSVSACPAEAIHTGEVVTVTLTCPTIAGHILPMLPTSISTTGTAYAP